MYNEVHIHMYVLGVGNASDPIIQVTIANHQLVIEQQLQTQSLIKGHL